MKNPRHRVVRGIALLMLIVFATALAACQVTGADPYLVAVSAPKDGDRIVANVQGEQLVMDISSPTGIGMARATILSAEEPAALELRLQLQGLEELRFAYGEQVIMVAVSSSGDGSVRQAVAQNGGLARPLTPDSPYWMEVRVEQSEPGGATPTPLFVVQAPPDFLQQGGRNFEVSWIDFYR